METVIRHTKRTIVFLAAIFCVLVGIAGLILPLIPGLVFLALALVIFSLFFPRVGERVHHHTRHYPKLHAAIVRMEDWVRRTIGEI